MKYYCPYCGTIIKKNQEKCTHCNYEFRRSKQNYNNEHSDVPIYEENYSDPLNEETGKSVCNIIHYIVIVLFLIILFVLAYFIISNI